MRRLGALLIAVVIGGCFTSIADVESRDDGSVTVGGNGTGSGGGGGMQGGGGGSAGIDAAAGGAFGGSGGESGSGAGGMAGDTDAATPLFADDFSADLSNWQAVGDGNWLIVDGEAQQTSATAEQAILYAVPIDQADYRVVSRMRQLASTNAASAIEIGFRIEPTKPTLYHCNWEPNDGRIVIQYLDGSNQGVLLEKFVALPGGYDAYGWFTLELTVVASQITCRVLELLPDGALTAAANPLFVSGHVGLKTWRASGSFDWFRVYTP